MFVTLIAPPMLITYENHFYPGRKGAPSISLAYLARVIENLGINYEIIDCLVHDDDATQDLHGYKISGLPIEETVRRIDPRADVIGITSMFTTEWMIVRELAKQIRVRFPNATIIVGGEHATADSDNIITYDKAIDICFLGESDDSFEVFLKKFPERQHLETPGIAYRGPNGEVIRNSRLARRKDLDEHLPLWDKFDVKYYVDRRRSYSRIGTRAIPILATRGCPYKCTFCSNAQMWGTAYVMRSVDSVISEMKTYIEKYGIEHFDFIDLATSVNKTWFTQLCARIKEELPGITWEMTVGTRSEILDYETLKLVKDSGSNIIGLAPEAGSESMIKKVKKRLDFDRFFSTVKQAVNLDMDIKANIIVGFPHETPLELAKTAAFCMKLGWRGVKGVSVFRFTPFPGTELGTQYFKSLYPSAEEYESYVASQVGTGGARVVNVANLLRDPKDQFYAFVSNSLMVLSYFMSAIRRPRYFKELFVNLKRGCPVCPVEVALYYLLVRWGLRKPHQPRKTVA
jgi:anaerobic magnesium-protoporphyrin IX monomethyl ester cyclase